jgi:hypothetical protein
MTAKYEALKKECDEMVRANEKTTKNLTKGLEQSKKEKLQNGGFAEYSNMVTSIINSEHFNHGANK